MGGRFYTVGKDHEAQLLPTKRVKLIGYIWLAWYLVSWLGIWCLGFVFFSFHVKSKRRFTLGSIKICTKAHIFIAHFLQVANIILTNPKFLGSL